MSPLPTSKFNSSLKIIDSMPLIQPSFTGGTGNLLAFYQSEYANLDLIKPLVSRTFSNQTGPSQTFTEYSFTYSSSTAQPIYSLTSGYLYYVKNGTSYGQLLSGATVYEDILVLIPFPHVLTNYWSKSQPGNVRLLQECAYLNFSMLTDAELIALIKKPLAKFQQTIYKQKTSQNFSGTNWESSYLDLFKNNNVPIQVEGGELIARSRANPIDTSKQLLTLFFKFDDWYNHIDEVTAFFKYHQRRPGLTGHPMISKIVGVSPQTGSVSFIKPSQSGLREKKFLIQEFENLQLSPVLFPDYHPLAIDLDQHPHQVIVPNVTAPVNWPSTRLSLPADYDVAKIKIYNPFGLTITIEEGDPNQVTITPLTFSTTEQVVEFRAISPLGDLSVKVKANGELAHELILKFYEFKTFPVTFHKLIDPVSTHVTDMDEQKLLSVLNIANSMLGQQTGVYLYPTELNGIILHDLVFDAPFGHQVDYTPPESPLNGVDEIWIKLMTGSNMNTPRERLNFVFLWDYAGSGSGGLTQWQNNHGPYKAYSLVDVEQKDTDYRVAVKMIHEFGHWFAGIFNNIPSDPQSCSGGQHFLHEICPEGNWEFDNNLMGVYGGAFITTEQAQTFNNHAASVVP